MRSSALIPAGSELVLASDQRVCASMSRVGDEFQVRVAEDVVGPIGVVIPKGTVARAQISSLRKDFDLAIASLTLGGRTYPIGSDATIADIEKVRTRSRRQATPVIAGAGVVASRQTYRTDRCVPEGGRITTKLAEPLKIALTD
jgi:hypothetical protein